MYVFQKDDNFGIFWFNQEDLINDKIFPETLKKNWID